MARTLMVRVFVYDNFQGVMRLEWLMRQPYYVKGVKNGSIRLQGCVNTKRNVVGPAPKVSKFALDLAKKASDNFEAVKQQNVTKTRAFTVEGGI